MSLALLLLSARSADRKKSLLPFGRHPTLQRQSQADITPATAALRQPQLSAPPSTAKMQIPHYKTAVLILHTATKPNAAVITQPSSLVETESSGHTQAPTKSP